MSGPSLFKPPSELLEAARLERRLRLANPEKVALGQFFTREPHWLVAPVQDFIAQRVPRATTFLDPFAGEGNLLEISASVFGLRTRGLDISAEGWEQNDSLRRIPSRRGEMIITNPPYLARNSARRKGLWDEVGEYLEERGRDDLYQVALDRCLEAAEVVVAIIPETVLLSKYPKTHLALVAVIEDQMFSDTETPVCVACFDTATQVVPQVYLGGERIATLPEVLACRLEPTGLVDMRFNSPRGQIGLRAVDGVDPAERLRFMRAGELGYPQDRLKHSSRHMTFVEIPSLEECQLDGVLATANQLLNEVRLASRDLALSPFKGNNRNGLRRRRLDYTLARALLESAIGEVLPKLF